MDIGDAVVLIQTPRIDWSRPQAWCDLGSGTGTFTLALAQLLAPGSTVHAVDQNSKALAAIPADFNGVQILKITADLGNRELSLPTVDGILMANSLHFIRRQSELLKQLLTLTSQFVIVEYERLLPNPWGPYPVPFHKLRKLFAHVGVDRVEPIITRPSRYGGAIYSAFASWTP
jgi:SAM-dependent methyltransferase